MHFAERASNYALFCYSNSNLGRRREEDANARGTLQRSSDPEKTTTAQTRKSLPDRYKTRQKTRRHFTNASAAFNQQDVLQYLGSGENVLLRLRRKGLGDLVPDRDLDRYLR